VNTVWFVVQSFEFPPSIFPINTISIEVSRASRLFFCNYCSDPYTLSIDICQVRFMGLHTQYSGKRGKLGGKFTP
jgi:hypothetical protein